MRVTKLKQFDPLTEDELEKYWPIVKKVANKFANNNLKVSHVKLFSSREDLEGELYTALLEAVRLYDPNHSRKLKIEAWIYTRCYQRIIDFIRSKSWVHHIKYKELSEKNIPINYIVADSEILTKLEHSSSSSSIAIEDINEDLEMEEYSKYLFYDLKNDSTGKAYDILYSYYTKGFTIKEVCLAHSVNRKIFVKIIQETRREIEDRIKFDK